MKRLAIYGHIPKFTIRELIIYDQHRLFVTTPGADTAKRDPSAFMLTCAPNESHCPAYEFANRPSLSNRGTLSTANPSV